MPYVQARSQRVPLNLIGGAYEASSLPISAQEAINCYVEVGQGASNPASLRGVPGATQFTDLTNIRALHDAFGVLYVVAGPAAYRVLESGSVVLLGAVKDDGFPAAMTNNIFEVFIESAGDGYTVQVDNDTFSNVDIGFKTQGAHFIDGYIHTLEKNSGRFRFSAINDADSFNGIDFATAEGLPDNTVGMIIDHREIFLFGERSLERWYNDGVTPFSRVPGGFSERGCGAGRSPAKADNTVFWLGDDFIVYRLTEGRPERVSNHGIEQLIGKVLNPASGVGLAYSQDGHTFYQLTFPGELTVTYDASTQLWHTRKLYSRRDCGYQHHAYVYGKHFVGGTKLWQFDDSSSFDGDLERIRTIGPIRTGKRFSTMYTLGLLFETGANADYGVPKTIFLEISDDGGRTFSNRIEAEIGAKGQYTQEVTFRALGGMYDNERVLRLTLTDSAKFSLVEAYAEVA